MEVFDTTRKSVSEIIRFFVYHYNGVSGRLAKTGYCLEFGYVLSRIVCVDFPQHFPFSIKIDQAITGCTIFLLFIHNLFCIVVKHHIISSGYSVVF
jgi:hypothetical protein